MPERQSGVVPGYIPCYVTAGVIVVVLAGGCRAFESSLCRDLTEKFCRKGNKCKESQEKEAASKSRGRGTRGIINAARG